MVGYTFKGAFDRLRACDQPKVRKEIMEALKIKTSMAWSLRIRGLVMPTVKNYKDIEDIFKKYGIKKNIWEEIDVEIKVRKNVG